MQYEKREPRVTLFDVRHSVAIIGLGWYGQRILGKLLHACRIPPCELVVVDAFQDALYFEHSGTLEEYVEKKFPGVTQAGLTLLSGTTEPHRDLGYLPVATSDVVIIAATEEMAEYKLRTAEELVKLARLGCQRILIVNEESLRESLSRITEQRKDAVCGKIVNDACSLLKNC